MKRIKLEVNKPIRLQFTRSNYHRSLSVTYLDILLTDHELHVYNYDNTLIPNHNYDITKTYNFDLRLFRKVRKDIMKDYIKTHTVFNYCVEGTYTRPPTNNYKDNLLTILAPIYFEPDTTNYYPQN